MDESPFRAKIASLSKRTLVELVTGEASTTNRTLEFYDGWTSHPLGIETYCKKLRDGSNPYGSGVTPATALTDIVLLEPQRPVTRNVRDALARLNPKTIVTVTHKVHVNKPHHPRKLTEEDFLVTPGYFLMIGTSSIEVIFYSKNADENQSPRAPYNRIPVEDIIAFCQ